MTWVLFLHVNFSDMLAMGYRSTNIIFSFWLVLMFQKMLLQFQRIALVERVVEEVEGCDLEGSDFIWFQMETSFFDFSKATLQFRIAV
jgi:hypothetical protein